RGLHRAPERHAARRGHQAQAGPAHPAVRVDGDARLRRDAVPGASPRAHPHAHPGPPRAAAAGAAGLNAAAAETSGPTSPSGANGACVDFRTTGVLKSTHACLWVTLTRWAASK